MFYDPRTETHGLAHNPFNALVSPRPIGWISSVAKGGSANLAPYSYFNAVSSSPPFVMFSSIGSKDTLSNIQSTGEFVVNMAVAELKDALNTSSASVASDVDEFEISGLTKGTCKHVAVPRVAESPVALECLLTKVVSLESRDGTTASSQVVFGEVIGIHIDDSVIVEGIVDLTQVRPLARLGYHDYAIIDNIFAMPRPMT